MSRRLGWLKALIFIYLITIFIGSFILMGIIWMGSFEQLSRFLVIKHSIYYGLAGAIGGTLYCLRLFYWHSIRESLNIHKWWIWYVLRPIISAGTSVMTILLFQSGILFLIVNQTVSAQIGLAFLVGYGFGKVMDKLESLTVTLFNGCNNPSIDKSESQKDGRLS